MSFSNGTKLGAYEILGAIGAGGMGETYRAKDTRIARKGALAPDGARFAYVADNRIEVREIGQMEAKLLDGQRFLMVEPGEMRNELHIVLNWLVELKQRVPASR